MPSRMMSRSQRVPVYPVRKWFPGKGSAFVAPSVRIFYSTRIRANLLWWKQEKAPRQVLSCLKNGVRLSFHRPPPPLHASPLLVQNKDVEFVIQDLSKGDSLGAYAPLRPQGSNFLCRARVHTQASGKQRMVHNYRYLNSFCKKQTCRYEQVKDLHKLLRPQDWLLSLDVSAAYWHVPLHPATAHYLSFHLALPASYVNASGRTVQVPLQPGAYWALPLGSAGQYQVVERTCAALPFGYTNAPFIWTKVIKVLAQAMRARGIRCLWFIDDCLLALPSRPLAMLARKTVEDLFVRSGLTRAPDKGVWVPTQTLPDHLGVEISTASATGWIKVPHRRCQEISRSAKDILCRSAKSARRVPSDLLRSFLGKVSSIGVACEQARFRLRSLHDRHELWKPLSTLDRAALRDLQWWAEFHYSAPANGVPLWPSPPTRAIWTDASSELGYGSILQVPQAAQKAFGAWWSLPEKLQWHITMKELVAVRRGILRFANDLRGHTVCLYEDNQAVVAIIKNRTSSSPLLMNELRLLLALLEQLDIRLVPRYIRSELNPADIFSRLTDRDAWTLSPSVQRMLMERAQAMFRKSISLDAFACPQSKVTSRFASRHFAPEALAEDGLLLDWNSEVVWLNPPWALLPDVLCKLRAERPAAVLIVPVWPSQTWWPSLLALEAFHVDLPPPKFSVLPLHKGKTEPFLNTGVRLRAVFCRPGSKR